MRSSRKLALCTVLLVPALAALTSTVFGLAPLRNERGLTRPTVDALKHKSYRATIPGSKVTFDMVAIPGGTFLMGSAEDEKGRGNDEGPRHPVRIAPFWMGKCEVTWDEYDLFKKQDKTKIDLSPEGVAADAVTKPTEPYADETWGYGREGYPVLGISHHAAMEYCRWLSAKTGKAYRLPTEAEWEYAARCGTMTAYSFGDDPEKLAEYGWYARNSDEGTHPVGKKKANAWGLHDMYGNVAEWCLDHYQKDHYAGFPLDKLTLSPVKLPTASRYSHVARGGSWADDAARCRNAARRGSEKEWNKRDPEKPQSIWWMSNADYVGFRIVRAVTEQDNLKGIASKVTKESK